MRICEVDGCDGVHLAGGMCRLHYMRAYRNRHAKGPPRGELWTDAERAKLVPILDRAPNGLGVGRQREVIDVAAALGRSQGAVVTQLWKLRKRRATLRGLRRAV